MPAAESHTDPLAHGNPERAHAGFVRRSILTAASDDMDNFSALRDDCLLGQPVNLQTGQSTLAVPIGDPQHPGLSPGALIKEMFLPEIDLSIGEGRKCCRPIGLICLAAKRGIVKAVVTWTVPRSTARRSWPPSAHSNLLIRCTSNGLRSSIQELHDSLFHRIPARALHERYAGSPVANPAAGTVDGSSLKAALFHND
jgi:hypothetical protein